MKIKSHRPPQGLQQFQRDFGRFLRDPEYAACPGGIPARAAETYQELIFNNIRSFTDACFPVCQKIVTPTVWQALVRDFFRRGTSDDPLFTSIPGQFVAYLQSAPAGFALPEWFAELAHYEWVELAADIDGASVIPTAPTLLAEAAASVRDCLCACDATTRLHLCVNPTLRNLSYRWPVHRISADYQPDKAQDTYLLVLRDHTHQVRFIAANAMTAALVGFLSEASPRPEASLLCQFAAQIGFAEPNKLLTFIVPLLVDFIQQDVFTLTTHY